jgi:predicted esterase
MVRRTGANLLVGFHGYGETADSHLAQLEQIPGIDRWSVASVQALHPFYRRSGEEVVASWMTKLDRELAIEDNLGYIRSAIDALPARERLVFAGFSQGAGMAYRAAALIPANGLICLGGDVPPDVLAFASQLPPILIGRGHRDEWFTDEKLKKDLRSLEGRDVAVCEFDGGHEWSDAFRQRAGEFLSTLE